MAVLNLLNTGQILRDAIKDACQRWRDRRAKMTSEELAAEDEPYVTTFRQEANRD